jgi:hypothetical protein
LDSQQSFDHRADKAHKNESGSDYAGRCFSIDAAAKKEKIKRKLNR